MLPSSNPRLAIIHVKSRVILGAGILWMGRFYDRGVKEKKYEVKLFTVD